MDRFEVCAHDTLPGKMMVEYWRAGKFTAGIYPHQDGIRVVSKYMTGVGKDPSFPPAAIIYLGEEVVSLTGKIEPEPQITVRFAGVEKAPGGKFSIIYIPDQRQVLEPGKRYRITLEDLTFEEKK